MSKKPAFPIVDEDALRVRVSARMEALDLTQQQVARAANYPQSKLSAWLSGGGKKIRLDSLIRVLNAVGLGLVAAEIESMKEAAVVKKS